MAGRSIFLCVGTALLAVVAVAGCSPDLSPNTYNAAAVQQANKTDQGVVVGVRQVDVRVAGATGAVVGGAAGGIAGSQVGSGATSAFGALGGSVIGGLLGMGVERAGGDTTAYEYVVRKTNKELVSVTQKGDPPMAIGQRVLVIAGAQARIVPDYTVALPPETPEAAKESLRQAVQEGAPVSPAGGAAPEAGTTPAAPTTPAGTVVPVQATPLPAATDASPAASAPVVPAPAVPTKVAPAAVATGDAIPAVAVPPEATTKGPISLVPTVLTPSTPAPTATPAMPSQP